ncbi:AEC family transporter [Terribacillus sp. DMT04]|uniref:AEC family transporter n=1 Tax=Terribacillus sp. DMT04 TaxID=2850441 RepID=UPI001C2C8542|nr:AEC family transporter [Terribacillus sp. DMT04]QXE01092.1 AEC family transporter [Terribacillus sp. DMT04]
MAVLSLIFLEVIAPLLLLLGVGVILQRKFSLHLGTLSKLLTYCFLPVNGFINMYQSSMPIAVFGQIILFLLIFTLFSISFTEITSRLLKLDRGIAATYKNSVVLMNSGNYGIPVSQLVFQSNPLGVSIQLIVMVFQNLLTFTYGLYNMVSVKSQGNAILKELIRLPMIYAIILGVLCATFHVEIPNLVWNPIQSIADAFLAVALITLGAQVAQIKLVKPHMVLYLSTASRLLVGPSAALGIIFLLGLDGTIAQSLFIASSFPTSRNSSIFALEYNNNPDLAAQTVLVTTIVSSITVTFVVYLAGILFG